MKRFSPKAMKYQAMMYSKGNFVCVCVCYKKLLNKSIKCKNNNNNNSIYKGQK